jgi:hypothetical protein
MGNLALEKIAHLILHSFHFSSNSMGTIFFKHGALLGMPKEMDVLIIIEKQ